MKIASPVGVILVAAMILGFTAAMEGMNINYTTTSNGVTTSYTQNSTFYNTPPLFYGITWYTRNNQGTNELHVKLIIRGFTATSWTSTSGNGVWAGVTWSSGTSFDGIICRVNSTLNNVTDSFACQDYNIDTAKGQSTPSLDSV